MRVEFVTKSSEPERANDSSDNDDDSADSGMIHLAERVEESVEAQRQILEAKVRSLEARILEAAKEQEEEDEDDRRSWVKRTRGWYPTLESIQEEGQSKLHLSIGFSFALFATEMLTSLDN